MSNQPKFITAPRRHRRERVKLPSAGPVAHQIVSVSHGATDVEFIVDVSGTVSNWVDLYASFQVLVGEEWLLPRSADLSVAGRVTVQFDEDASAAMQWRVPDPDSWEFSDEQPLQAPFAGAV